MRYRRLSMPVQGEEDIMHVAHTKRQDERSSDFKCCHFGRKGNSGTNEVQRGQKVVALALSKRKK